MILMLLLFLRMLQKCSISFVRKSFYDEWVFRMKLSLSWIFDHIVTPLSRYTITDIVQRFNKTTAEIEGWTEVHFDKEKYAIAKVTLVDVDSVTVHCSEWGKIFSLAFRSDAKEGLLFIITHDKKGYRWATCQDWHSTKEGLLPSVFVPSQDIGGQWKEHIASTDYIIEVDNKSITHRPDLWGHYGFAREIAAMLKTECNSQEKLYASLPIHYETSKSCASTDNPYSFEIKEVSHVKAFAGVYIKHGTYQQSVPWMMYKLCLVDVRPIDTIVDATNYTMYDIGQPLHAFNADALEGSKLIARLAKTGEMLTLLDEEKIALDTHDIVIADSKKVVSLAGIMGGQESAVSEQIHNILVEAACFDAATIRRSATRHKKRTDAAVRFEKTLDPHQVIHALRRFVQLLHDCGMRYTHISAITALGHYPAAHVITIFHSFIENKLGITLEPRTVIILLEALGFAIVMHDRGHDKEYTITVPSFRSSKDIRLKEDIVEEVARALGYDALKPSTPCIKATVSDLHVVHNRRTIKNICTNGLRLQEVYTYALFDEHFLKHIQWNPSSSIKVQKPVSENRQQLITSLIPQLLSVVRDNAAHNDELRFFELARIWHNDNSTLEKKSLAGIVYYKHKEFSFYAGKSLLEELFLQMRISVTWRKVDHPKDPWFIPYQTAAIQYKDTIIGYAGLSHPLFFEKIAPGSAFIFELDADFILNYTAETMIMRPLSKFPDIVRDISLLVPLTTTVGYLKEVIKTVDTHIVNVELQDFFEKEEWGSHRSVTFRYTLRNYHKTMTKQESDMVHDALVQKLSSYGVQIR